MLQIKKVNLKIISKYPYMELVKGEGYFYFSPLTVKQVGTLTVESFNNWHKKVKGLQLLETTSVMTFKLNDLTLEQWIEEADKLNEAIEKEMSETHITTKRHYEEYSTITGGTARPILKKIVMEMIGGNLKALKKAYRADKHLNNIDEVLKEAGTQKTFGNFSEPKVTVEHILGKKRLTKTSYQRNSQKFREDFKSRCTRLGISSEYVKMLSGPYNNGWFLSFDYYIPEFVSATKETRKKWKELSGGYHSGGVSNSTVCSSLKHIMIFEILGYEFEEEKDVA